MYSGRYFITYGLYSAKMEEITVKDQTVIINKVSEVMGRKRMSIKDLQRATGISYPAAYSLYHAKTTSISFDVLEKLCIALEVQPGDLFVLEPEGS